MSLFNRLPKLYWLKYKKSISNNKLLILSKTILSYTQNFRIDNNYAIIDEIWANVYN